MKGEVNEHKILKEVSRSFYLSLRALPREMQAAAILAYLLARVTDTLTDAPGIPADMREECLLKFQAAVASLSAPEPWPGRLLEVIDHQGERHLLMHSGEIFQKLTQLPYSSILLIQEVIKIISCGQLLDLKRFTGAPYALKNEEELDDYTWRVAGSVGQFWTKLGFLTMGDRYSQTSPEDLCAKGILYGKGLQLINILRDLPVDLALGRCYLPVADPFDREEVLKCHEKWLKTAVKYLAEGESYAETLLSKRLRLAAVLPAFLGRETAKLLHGVTWEALERRPKITRGQVYVAILRGVLF